MPITAPEQAVAEDHLFSSRGRREADEAPASSVCTGSGDNVTEQSDTEEEWDPFFDCDYNNAISSVIRGTVQ